MQTATQSPQHARCKPSTNSSGSRNETSPRISQLLCDIHLQMILMTWPPGSTGHMGDMRRTIKIHKPFSKELDFLSNSSGADMVELLRLDPCLTRLRRPDTAAAIERRFTSHAAVTSTAQAQALETLQVKTQPSAAIFCSSGAGLPDTC